MDIPSESAFSLLQNLTFYKLHVHYTGQQKHTFSKQELEMLTYSGAEWCPKQEVAFRFSQDHTVF